MRVGLSARFEVGALPEKGYDNTRMYTVGCGLAGATRVFSSVGECERAGIRALAEGALVLCATARLARRLLHRYRQERLASGKSGWETPPVRSFRGWVHETYADLWLPRRPLSPALSLWFWQPVLFFTALLRWVDVV